VNAAGACPARLARAGIFTVSPDKLCVTNPVVGRDMVMLQTCTETPEDWWNTGPRLYLPGI
jgi:hypothetical protein